MKAIIYKTLSNKQTIINFEKGLTIENTFNDIDFENAVCIVNGKEVNPNYELKENDLLIIRQLPSAITTTAILAISIITAVVAVVGGIVGGVLLYKARKRAKAMQEELDKMKKLTNKSDIDNRPFLRGASNSKATGNSQPYICGRHFFTPYLLGDSFYKLSGQDGEEQYTYIALQCGFNKQVIEKIAIEDITIKSFNTLEPQEGVFNLDNNNIFAQNGLLEIAQDGELLSELQELNYKTLSNSCNDEIPRDSKVIKGNAEYLTYSLDTNARSIEIAITFPYGLYAYNNDNDKIQTSIKVTPQYSLDGGDSWIDFNFDNNGTLTNTFKRNISTKELRFLAHKEFNLSDYQILKSNNQNVILLRVRSNGSDDGKIKNDVFVLYYQTVCFDPIKSSLPAGTLNDGGTAGLVPCLNVEDRERNLSTVLGLKIKATKNNEKKLSKINVITKSVSRIWNGTEWSLEKSITSNPSAIALEILTSDSHLLSKYQDNEIDLESFGELYNFCEENNFKFDYVISQNASKGDSLNKIMDCCGAVLYVDMLGRISVAIDNPQSNALAVYNPQNIISITNKKTFDRRTDGLRIKYISSQNDLFTEDTYLLMRTKNGTPLELNQDSKIKDIRVTGITNFEHVIKYARRLMAIEVLRNKTTTIEVGNEGIYYTPLSKVLLQDDSLKIGLGSSVIRSLKWSNGLLKEIVVENIFNFDIAKEHGVIVNAFSDNGAVPLSIQVAGMGETNILTVISEIRDTDLIIPEVGCLLSFGELNDDGSFDKITTPYLISNITRSTNGFRLELVNYNEAIFDVGLIPEYKPNITTKNDSEKKDYTPIIKGLKGDPGTQGKDGKDGNTISFPTMENADGHFVFDETHKDVPSVQPSYSAWQNKIIEYDCTGKTKIEMSFEDAIYDTIILKGILSNNFTLQFYFNENNLNGAKRYDINYQLTGDFNVILTTGVDGASDIQQTITADAFGFCAFCIVDYRGNIWQLEGNRSGGSFNISNVASVIDEDDYFVKERGSDKLPEKIIKTDALKSIQEFDSPIGAVKMFFENSYKHGYLECNGQLVSPDVYPELTLLLQNVFNTPTVEVVAGKFWYRMPILIKKQFEEKTNKKIIGSWSEAITNAPANDETKTKEAFVFMKAVQGV